MMPRSMQPECFQNSTLTPHRLNGIVTANYRLLQFNFETAQQTTAYKKEKFLFAYVLDTMQRAGFSDEPSESAKYLMMAGINLVNCIANAKRNN